MGNDKEVVRKHMVACASVSATDKVQEFGIDTQNYFFRFWDWVGGRYSVCSAAGAVPISLLYGFELFEKFLKVRISCFACILSHFYPSKVLIPAVLSGCSIYRSTLHDSTF
jgi:glucose-6-phosphate isomerase